MVADGCDGSGLLGLLVPGGGEGPTLESARVTRSHRSCGSVGSRTVRAIPRFNSFADGETSLSLFAACLPACSCIHSFADIRTSFFRLRTQTEDQSSALCWEPLTHQDSWAKKLVDSQLFRCEAAIVGLSRWYLVSQSNNPILMDIHSVNSVSLENTN